MTTTVQLNAYLRHATETLRAQGVLVTPALLSWLAGVYLHNNRLAVRNTVTTASSS